jgi:hypothetical protein
VTTVTAGDTGQMAYAHSGFAIPSPTVKSCAMKLFGQACLVAVVAMARVMQVHGEGAGDGRAGVYGGVAVSWGEGGGGQAEQHRPCSPVPVLGGARPVMAREVIHACSAITAGTTTECLRERVCTRVHHMVGELDG